jgi:hypothetical protein
MLADHSTSLIRAILLLLIGAAMGGCSSSNIRSDYDHDADFGAYETFNFMDGAGQSQEGYDSLFSQYMTTAITIEMEKRGYVKAQSPDLLVNFNVQAQEKTKVTQSASAPPAYYGYRGRAYDPWGGYGYGTQTHVSQYTEGTFNIDLIDARKKKLVWEAVGIGRISEKMLKNLEKNVQEGVPEFFAYYPFVAGSAVPVQPK